MSVPKRAVRQENIQWIILAMVQLAWEERENGIT